MKSFQLWKGLTTGTLPVNDTASTLRNGYTQGANRRTACALTMRETKAGQLDEPKQKRKRCQAYSLFLGF